jgi:hypothetical protein
MKKPPCDPALDLPLEIISMVGLQPDRDWVEPTFIPAGPCQAARQPHAESA